MSCFVASLMPLKISSHTFDSVYFTPSCGRSPYDHDLHSLAGSTILSIAYGLKVLPSNDPYIEVAEAGLFSLAKAAAPGAFLVDSLPFLKYVPDWFPGKSHTLVE